MFRSGDPIPLEDIHSDLVTRVGQDAPQRARLITAKALVPMEPLHLCWALSVLSRDTDEEIAQSAQRSLQELPTEMTDEIVAGDALPGSVLDAYAHAFRQESGRLLPLVTNPKTHDETLRWMARHLAGEVLDALANNQQRLLTDTGIVEAFIANPLSPTPLLARVVETTMRGGVDTTEISGFKPLAEAFFADLTSSKETSDGLEPSLEGLEEGVLEQSASQGISDELFAQAVVDGQVPVAADAGDAEGEEEEEGETRSRQPLWKLIEDMSVAQKVRLAMVGTTEARRILVRDVKAVVSLSVLRSPKLNTKDVAKFATDKAISKDVIHAIARSREWTKSYAVKLALLWHPKCPATRASHFVRYMHRKDIVALSRAKDVAGYVKSEARRIKDRQGW
jgi:hypothetical protein